jgi:hypothetical protein
LQISVSACSISSQYRSGRRRPVKSKRMTTRRSGSRVSAEHVAHRPQRHKGIEVLGGELEPGGTPLAERHADLEEVVTRGGELVVASAPFGFGCRLDDAEPFELLEPLREQGAGEPGRALQDLTETSAAQPQVADDHWRPALGEDLGATGDGAILAVGPHDASVAPLPSAVKSRLLTSQPRSTVVRWGRRETRTTTPTTERVGHLSEQVTAMEIDGFRGQLITADHADYDTARAVWNGAVDRRPRLIARCSV